MSALIFLIQNHDGEKCMSFNAVLINLYKKLVE